MGDVQKLFKKLFYLVDHISNYKMPLKVISPIFSFEVLIFPKLRQISEEKRRIIDTKSMANDEDMKDLYAEKLEKKREEEAERFKGLSARMKAKKER